MRKFSESFKRQVIQEVMTGQMSKEEARRRYNIKGKTAILNWIRKFDIPNPIIMSDHPLSEKELLAKIKRLEQLKCWFRSY